MASIAALGLSLCTSSATLLVDLRASAVDLGVGSVDSTGKLVILNGNTTGNITLQIWAQVTNAAPASNVFGIQVLLGSIKSSVGLNGPLLTGTMNPAVLEPTFSNQGTTGTVTELTVPADGSLDLGSNATTVSTAFIKARKDPTANGTQVGTVFFASNLNPAGATVNPISNGFEFLMGTATFSIQSFTNPVGSFSLNWAIPAFTTPALRGQIAQWTDGDGAVNNGANQFADMFVGNAVTFALAAPETTSTWIATGGGSFGSAANWSPSVPGTTMNAFFGPTIQTASTVSLDGNRSVKTVVFNSPNSYTIAQGSEGALSVGEGISVQTGLHTVSAPVEIGSGTSVSVLNSGDNLEISGSIAGTGGLLKAGSGKLVLSGANTFAGATTVTAGTVVLNATGANSVPGDATITGGTLRLSKSDQISDASHLSISSGVIDLSANSETVSFVEIAGGTITGTGTLTALNPFDVRAGGITANLAGAVGLNKTTAGTATLAGANTYTGLTQVNAGVLQLSRVGGNSIAGNLLVGSGATARLGASDQIPDSSSVTLNGGTLDIISASETVGVLQLVNGSVIGSGTLSSAAPFDLQNGTVAARLSGTSGVNKTTNGTVTLSGLNTYTGTTTVSGGILRGNSDSLHGQIVNDATLVFQQSGSLVSNIFSGNISGTGGVVIEGTTSVNFAEANTYQGGTTINSGALAIAHPSALPFGRPVHIDQAGTLTLNTPPSAQTIGTLTGSGTVFLSLSSSLTIGADNGSGTFSGVINGASNPIIKTGTGTQTLSGLHNLAGPTSVNGGRLIVTGNWTSPAYTAGAGGILKFDAISVTLGSSSIRANAGGAVEYGNVTINGGFLRGPGIHTVLAGATADFNGVTTFNSSVLIQNGLANLANFSNGGQITNNAAMNWDGGGNSSSGRLTVNHTANVRDWTNDGVVTINSGGNLNVSGSDLVSGGGSRFFVSPGGQLNVEPGFALSLQGSLLVNNGSINGQTTIDYGATAQGTGVFGPVSVLNGGRFSPGNSPGTANVNGPFTMGAGGSLDVEIFDASGTAGATNGWDLVKLLGPNGVLNVQSGNTSNSRFVIRLFSGDGSGTLPALNFDRNSIYDWLIADSSQGITGFDPGDISIDSAGFVNPLNGGEFSVIQSSGDLFVRYQPVPEPSITALVTGCLGFLGLRRRR